MYSNIEATINLAPEKMYVEKAVVTIVFLVFTPHPFVVVKYLHHCTCIPLMVHRKMRIHGILYYYYFIPFSC